MEIQIDVKHLEVSWPRLDHISEKYKNATLYTNSDKLSREYTYIKFLNNLKPKKGVFATLSTINFRKTYKLNPDSNIEKQLELCKLLFINSYFKNRQNKKNPRIEHGYTQSGTMYEKVGGVLKNRDTFFDLFIQKQYNKVKTLKLPNTNDHHVGIEFEVISPISESMVIQRVIDLKLTNKIRVMSDSSIQVEPGYEHTMEICVLTTENTFEKDLNDISKLFKQCHFIVNKSCGLHVHFDMRNRDYKKPFNNLVRSQVVLFNLVHESRRSNRYCRYVNTVDPIEVAGDHYQAISSYPIRKYNTIEVRLHEGTVDTNEVKNWINLLLKIVNYDQFIVDFNNEKDLILDQDNKNYINSKGA